MMISVTRKHRKNPAVSQYDKFRRGAGRTIIGNSDTYIYMGGNDLEAFEKEKNPKTVRIAEEGEYMRGYFKNYIVYEF